jgi:predicted HicB family RNase H-like nuclease
MMSYKGYTAGPIDFDPEDSVFSGTVADLKDVIHFEGGTAKELEKSFRDGIDDYLALCVERGEAPDRPFNGKIPVRTAPRLHRKARPPDLRNRMNRGLS